MQTTPAQPIRIKKSCHLDCKQCPRDEKNALCLNQSAFSNFAAPCVIMIDNAPEGFTYNRFACVLKPIFGTAHVSVIYFSQ